MAASCGKRFLTSQNSVKIELSEIKFIFTARVLYRELTHRIILQRDLRINSYRGLKIGFHKPRIPL